MKSINNSTTASIFASTRLFLTTTLLFLFCSDSIMLTSAFSRMVAPSRVAAAARASSTTMRTATFSSTDTTDRISSTLQSLWNEQVQSELLASQVYLAASIWCKDQELEGMSKYMRNESDEERSHAMGIIEFAQKKGINIELKQLDAPPTSWDTVQDLWEDLLALEQTNTKSLFRLNDEASACGDPAITTFLQPYHTEQVESEDDLKSKLAKVRDEAKTPGLIRQLDEELGEAADKAEQA